MSNPLLITPHSKLDTRVKETSGVQTTPDRFTYSDICNVLYLFSLKE